MNALTDGIAQVVLIRIGATAVMDIWPPFSSPGSRDEKVFGEIHPT